MGSDSDSDSDGGHDHDSKRGNPCCTMCLGFALLVTAIVVLGHNEFRTVCRMSTLIYVEDNAKIGDCDDEPSRYDGGVVFLSCPLDKDKMNKYRPSDLSSKFDAISAEFSSIRAMQYQVSTEVFQCVEHKETHCEKQGSNGCKKYKTTFSYETKFSADLIDSSQFCRKEKSGSYSDSAKLEMREICGNSVNNPGSDSFNFPLSERETADTYTMGTWLLNSKVIKNLVKNSDAASIENHGVKEGSLPSDKFKQDDRQPPLDLTLENVTPSYQDSLDTCSVDDLKVGCVRVKFRAIRPTRATLVYAVSDDVLQDISVPAQWVCPSDIFSFASGSSQFQTLDTVMEKLHSENSLQTIFMRILGFFLVFLGLYLIFSPIEWLLNYIPFCGDCLADLVGCVLMIFEFFIALAISLFVIAVMWVFMRPKVGAILLAICALFLGLSMFLARYHGKRKRRGAKLLGNDEEVGYEME